MSHDPEVRAACMSLLLQGQGVAEVSKAYNLPPSTVSRWRKEARREAGRSEDVGALLLEYLQEALRTAKAQQMVFRDQEWLREQDASSLGVLHGVTIDKCIRLLEAMDASPIEPDYNG